MNRDERLEDKLAEIINLADLLCTGLGRPMYIATAVKNLDTYQVLQRGQWVGTWNISQDHQKSRAPYVAPWKLAEVLQKPSPKESEIIMTPDTFWEASTGWMGAVRTIQGDLDVSIAASKWAQEHDKLLALLLLYHSCIEQVKLHHIGFRLPSLKAYKEANKSFEGRYEPLVRDVEDHQRTYFKTSSWPKFYREHQYFPEGPHGEAIHWDVVCKDPINLLNFLANGFNTKPITWAADKNDPVGVVWIKGEDNTLLGVMGRSTWWDIELPKG